MLTNFWKIFYAVSLFKIDIDTATISAIDRIFDKFSEEQQKLTPSYSNSFLGLQKIFSECVEDFEIETYRENAQILPAECRIALKNITDLAQLTSLLTDYFDFSTSTCPSYLSGSCPSESININIGTNGFTFYYQNAVETTLEFDIQYTRVDNYKPIGTENDQVRAEFERYFKEYQKMGKDFDPDVYLSNERLSFIASFTIGWRIPSNPPNTYTYAKKEHIFGELFVLPTTIDNTTIQVQDIT